MILIEYLVNKIYKIDRIYFIKLKIYEFICYIWIEKFIDVKIWILNFEI